MESWTLLQTEYATFIRLLAESASISITSISGSTVNFTGCVSSICTESMTISGLLQLISNLAFAMGASMEKKINLSDVTIQIRILKALADIKPFGVFKHFYMAKIIRNLKQPNVITARHIWEFLESEYDTRSYDERADAAFQDETCTFDKIFDE